MEAQVRLVFHKKAMNNCQAYFIDGMSQLTSSLAYNIMDYLIKKISNTLLDLIHNSDIAMP